MTMIAHWIK